MQLPRANQATKSSCSSPSGRNSLYKINKSRQNCPHCAYSIVLWKLYRQNY